MRRRHAAAVLQPAAGSGEAYCTGATTLQYRDQTWWEHGVARAMLSRPRDAVTMKSGRAAHPGVESGDRGGVGGASACGWMWLGGRAMRAVAGKPPRALVAAVWGAYLGGSVIFIGKKMSSWMDKEALL